MKIISTENYEFHCQNLSDKDRYQLDVVLGQYNDTRDLGWHFIALAFLMKVTIKKAELKTGETMLLGFEDNGDLNDNSLMRIAALDKETLRDFLSQLYKHSGLVYCEGLADIIQFKTDSTIH